MIIIISTFLRDRRVVETELSNVKVTLDFIAVGLIFYLPELR
jgi:hypothetical protein